MLAPDRIGEVRANDDAVEVGDHEEGWVLQRLPIVEELFIGLFEVLVMAFVLPTEVPAKPDVRPPTATARLGRTLLESICFTPAIGIGSRHTKHCADVDEMFLCGSTFSVGIANPLCGELGSIHDCL